MRNYLAGADAAGADAAAEEDASFLAFFTFLAFGADAEAAAAEAEADADAGAWAKADTANREATRAAIILDMMISFFAVNKTAQKNKDSDESASLTWFGNFSLTR
jgi:hypothetical protein